MLDIGSTILCHPQAIEKNSFRKFDLIVLNSLIFSAKLTAGLLDPTSNKAAFALF